MGRILGIDIGGTKCAVILGNHNSALNNESIDIVDKISFPTEVQKGWQYSIDRILDNIKEIMEKNDASLREVQSVGISCGGPLNSKEGVIMSPPNLIGWDNVPIAKIISKELGVKVKLQNDANACALAEWKLGAARGYSNVIFLTFGTGLGAGLILDGRLYSGRNDMAGEVGHIRLHDNGPVGYGKSGSFEGFCSGGGIAQLAKTKVLEKFQMGEAVSFCRSIDEIESLNAAIVGEAAEKGDKLAREIYTISGRNLGRGLSILIDILNPEIIVIGSIFARRSDLLWGPAEAVIKEESLAISRKNCRIVPTELGEKIGDYAALTTAIYD